MRRLLLISLLLFSYSIQAQNGNIVKIIDDLTAKWDQQAVDLAKYSGMKYYCNSEIYKNKTIGLLDKIHHYDTLLYQIVDEKYKNTKDKEAQTTLKEILTVETDYTTPNFKAFLTAECEKLAQLKEEYGTNDGSSFYKEVGKLEKELSKYINSITERIDLIDEHIHHLQLD